jgi:hypothetical protein
VFKDTKNTSSLGLEKGRVTIDGKTYDGKFFKMMAKTYGMYERNPYLCAKNWMTWIKHWNGFSVKIQAFCRQKT